MVTRSDWRGGQSWWRAARLLLCARPRRMALTPASMLLYNGGHVPEKEMRCDDLPPRRPCPASRGRWLKTLAARPRIARPTTGRTVPADRKIIRVELLSLYLENWKVPASVGGRAGDKIKAPGFPAFDPATGEAASVPADRETELVTGQLKPCLEPLACLWTKY
jgi:hypothetical protein